MFSPRFRTAPHRSALSAATVPASTLSRLMHDFPLANLVGPLAGATIGYLASRRGDRLKRAERRQTVAGALGVEVARIRSALGRPHDHRTPDPVFFGVTQEPPQIHPWLERVIVDGAEISPEVVGGFMALQRELSHFTTLLAQWREAAALAALSSAADAGLARARAEALHRECIETQRMAIKVLDDLDALLAPPPRSAVTPSWDEIGARLKTIGITLLEDFGLRDTPKPAGALATDERH